MRRAHVLIYGALVLAGACSVILADQLYAPRPFVAEPCPQAPDDVRCWEDFYLEFARDDGAVAALSDLKARYAVDGPARTHCHALLHRIGAAAADEFGSISRAYAHGDTFCRSGFHHGVLEGVFVREGSTALLDGLDSICADVDGRDRYAYDYFSCVHGIGHGLMAHYSHDLFQSLTGCDNLTAEWERSSCYGGVFMENITADAAGTPSSFLSDDPHYPCNAVDERYRAQCYMMQTSHMLTLFAGDFSKVFSECSRAEDAHRATCFQSLGRDASGWSYGSIASVLDMCGQGDADSRPLCLAGAAIDFVQSRSVDEARVLCAEDSTGTCGALLETHISAL